MTIFISYNSGNDSHDQWVARLADDLDQQEGLHVIYDQYDLDVYMDKNKFMVEIGAGIMANKTLPEALALIGARKKEMENVTKKLQVEMEKIANSMNQIGIELQKLNAEAAGKGDEGISVE